MIRQALKGDVLVKRKKNKLLLALALVVMIGSGVVFVSSTYDYFTRLRETRTTRTNAIAVQEIFAEYFDNLESDTFQPDLSVREDFDTFISPVILARELTGNSDIVAYIHIEGTNISNVVVQGEDNIFYLYHDVNKRVNVNGSIFLDYLNSPYFTDRNTIIYGHNMINGAMFHNIRYFMNLDFFMDNRYITIITKQEILTYEIFSAFATRIDFEYIQVYFYDDNDFLQLLGEVQRRCLHGYDISLDADDRILILSTCTNTAQDMRFVVAAVLKE